MEEDRDGLLSHDGSPCQVHCGCLIGIWGVIFRGDADQLGPVGGARDPFQPLLLVPGAGQWCLPGLITVAENSRGDLPSLHAQSVGLLALLCFPQNLSLQD